MVIYIAKGTVFTKMSSKALYKHVSVCPQKVGVHSYKMWQGYYTNVHNFGVMVLWQFQASNNATSDNYVWKRIAEIIFFNNMQKIFGMYMFTLHHCINENKFNRKPGIIIV